MSNSNFPPRNTRNSQKAKDDSTSITRDRSRARTDSRGEDVIHPQPRALTSSGQGHGHSDGDGNTNSAITTACPIPGTPTTSRGSTSRAGSCTDSWEYPGTPSLLLSNIDPNKTVQASTNISVHITTQIALSTHRSRSQDLFEQQDVTKFIEGTRKVLNQEMDIREQLSRTEGDEATEERRFVVIVSG
ncbi:hypothetical protein BY996DRAFT_6479796 [Phakopsora pachyrhizi]|nr:hypothetical protein BY996DRAFT_6479796 [Phakopsora pachyrhizi]